MSPERQDAQAMEPTARKRRPHKRSRNGCLTCKQRHIRCDEQKPVCTNCLVRGGECGYPETTTSATASSSRQPALGSLTGQLSPHPPLSRILPAAPSDPFDSLPIPMPHRSLELFHHFTHYRVYSRTKIPRNPDSTIVAIALSHPMTFRACLLLAAMHYAWMEGSIRPMEETYIYHKLETMRLINECLADPASSSSDVNINMISALALAESGMGDTEAAEAHLHGLFTLLDMKRPELWQHRFYGLLQRTILLTGCFIAATKTYDKEELQELVLQESASIQNPHHIRPTGPIFSTVPFIATRLSPFYMCGPPDIERCKADAEGEVLVTALRRLSGLPSISVDTSSPGSSPDSSRGLSTVVPLSPEVTPILLADTESYIASLLFKPQPLAQNITFERPEALRSRADSTGASPTPSSGIPVDPELLSPPSGRSSAVRSPVRPSSPVEARLYPYAQLSPELFPSPSQAWASAAQLYLHIVLESLWRSPKPLDPHLTRWLLETLRDDIAHTEEAMIIGAYSSELWLWKVVVAALALTVVGPQILSAESGQAEFNMRTRVSAQHQQQQNRPQTRNAPRGRSAMRAPLRRDYPDSDDDDSSSSSEDSSSDSDVATLSVEMERHLWARSPVPPRHTHTRQRSDVSSSIDPMDEDRADRSGFGALPETHLGRYNLDDLRPWFSDRIRAWSCAARVTSWHEAKRALTKIAWVDGFDREHIVEAIWRSAVAGEGSGRISTSRHRRAYGASPALSVSGS